MAALFLLQALVGAASQHYRAEVSNFFGLDLAQILPFNLARTWHLQLAIFWVATSFLAAGIFLAPMIGGREPKIQKWLAIGLLCALALVVFGSLAGEFAGIHGLIHRGWSWFGDQGFEYLDLGRFWQILLTLGSVLLGPDAVPGLRDRLQTEHNGNMPWLFLFSALAIPPSTPWDCLPSPIATSPPPISGAFGWCICGWKISWSCSPPSWWPASSSC